MTARLGRLLAAAAVLAAAGPARAQTSPYTFQFADTAGQPLGSVSIDGVDSTTDVRVYLRETGGQNTLRNTGLAGAEVRVRFNTPGGIAAVLRDTDITGSPQFEVLFRRQVSATDAILTEATFNVVQAPADDPTRIYLGTFTLTGQGIGTVALSADSLGSGGTLLSNGTDISDGISSGTVSVVVTPEPGWLLLLGLVPVGLAARRRSPPARANAAPGRLTWSHTMAPP